MRLYRVFPYDCNAAPTDRGGGLFAPLSSAGRIDNPDLYRTFYASSDPEGAIAEVFGRLAIWKPADFTHANGQPYVLATYELAEDPPVFVLDDIEALRSIGVQHPSAVVTRDRKTTQAWARTIYQQHAYAGACWWCYYEPSFRSYGLWDLRGLSLMTDPSVITTSAACVRKAAATIVRQIVDDGG